MLLFSGLRIAIPNDPLAVMLNSLVLRHPTVQYNSLRTAACPRYPDMCKYTKVHTLNLGYRGQAAVRSILRFD